MQKPISSNEQVRGGVDQNWPFTELCIPLCLFLPVVNCPTVPLYPGVWSSFPCLGFAPCVASGAFGLAVRIPAVGRWDALKRILARILFKCTVVGFLGLFSARAVGRLKVLGCGGS
jgi:hypothetical protein